MGAPVLSLLPLAVQILIPASSDEQHAILEACTLAHSGSPCERNDLGNEPEALRGRVSVLGPSRVLVEVRAESENENYLSVELSFSEHDQPRERARSIGLSLGTLASSLEQKVQRDESTGLEQAPSAESIKEPEERAQGAALLPIRAGVGVSYDPSWATPALRADLRAQWAPSGGFFFALAGNADFSPGSTPRPTLTSFGGNAGFGYAFRTGALYWFPELALGASFNLLNVKDAPVVTAQGTRTSGVAGASVHCLIPIHGSFYLSLLPEVELLMPSTDVYVDDEQVGGLGPLRFALTVGAAWNTTP